MFVTWPILVRALKTGGEDNEAGVFTSGTALQSQVGRRFSSIYLVTKQTPQKCKKLNEKENIPMLIHTRRKLFEGVSQGVAS